VSLQHAKLICSSELHCHKNNGDAVVSVLLMAHENYAMFLETVMKRIHTALNIEEFRNAVIKALRSYAYLAFSLDFVVQAIVREVSYVGDCTKHD